LAQHNVVAIAPQRYTRADFAALRARLNKIPTATILRLYFTEDALDTLHCPTPALLEKRIDALRDHLVQRLSLSAPTLSEHLANARKFHSWPKSLIDYLVNAAEADSAAPRLGDAVSVWFKPPVAKALQAEGMHSLAEFRQYALVRGPGWYRPVARIGQGKARALERWLAAQPTLGGLVMPVENIAGGEKIELGSASAIAPLERIGAVAEPLSGAQGLNRGAQFCLVSARNDLEAIQAYLYRYRDRDKTHRAYQKELERFLLWCVIERRVALSSVLTDDCEAYKDFLSNVPGHWVGAKAARNSARWRPFLGTLEPASQRYAVIVIRACFSWLVQVRYLGGNPWVTVADPRVAHKEMALDIDKALPEALWQALASGGGLLDQACANDAPVAALQAGPRSAGMALAQWRLARAAILLLGSTGLRREELAGATRSRLRRVPEETGAGLWELSILGKRNKWRTVWLPERVVDSVRAHWADRGHDFEAASILGTPADLALLSPVALPPLAPARRKHAAACGQNAPGGLSGAGFTPNGLYHLVKTALARIALSPNAVLSKDERNVLSRAAPHALRHTFATRAAAAMPLDVLQRLLGHASSQTTSIYVRAERTRSLDEAKKFFAR